MRSPPPMRRWARSGRPRSSAFSPGSTSATASREYLAHLPRIERYLANNLAHPLLQPLAVWYQAHLPRALGEPPVNPSLESRSQSRRWPAVPKTAMVFAAGLGTRMRPITEKLPKPLVKVAGKALIDHCLDRFAEEGVERAIVNVHWLADQIEAHLAARRAAGNPVLRRAGTLARPGRRHQARAAADRPDPFFLCNTDAFWIEGPRSNLARLAAAFDPERMDAALLVAASAGAVGVDWPGDFSWTPKAGSRRARIAMSRPSSTPALASSSPSFSRTSRPKLSASRRSFTRRPARDACSACASTACGCMSDGRKRSPRRSARSTARFFSA